jgi:benzoyl-CoA reductase subunit C
LRIAWPEPTEFGEIQEGEGITHTLETLREVREINSSYPYTVPIRACKEQGKKVIAFQCTYVPEEIIYAAGMVPIRLAGDSREPALEEANAYLYINTCSFVRSCLDMVLRNQYHFLDGFVSAATCDCPRRMTDVWKHYKFTPFVHILDVPRKMTEPAHKLYHDQVKAFKERLEAFFDLRISDEALRQAIRVHNRTRGLLRELYQMRKSDRPPITGTEVLEVLNAGFNMPREEFNGLLERLVGEASSGQRTVDGRFRLMINGSPLNNPDFVKAIEDLGGLVVVDELCTGVRNWWEMVDESPETDPLEALSRRYLNNFPCPRMYPPEERFNGALQLVKDYRVEGVVSEIVRYCVHCAHDQPLLRRRLERQGVPVLELSIEYGTSGTGQIRTRVQAFLEMLEGRPGK